MSIIPRKKDKECEACPLFNQKVVWGAGKPSSCVVLVGEHPRRDDVESGAPFAGSFVTGVLRDSLKKANLAEGECYKTFAVKCEIPKDWNKSSKKFTEAITCCKSKLDKELELIGPEAVLLFGDIPLRAVLDKHRISVYRGLWQAYKDIPVLPTYSIFGMFHGKKTTGPLIAKDIAEVGRRISGEEESNTSETKVIVLDSFAKIKLFFNKLRKIRISIAFDTETSAWLRKLDRQASGKQPALNYLDAKFLCWSFSWNKAIAYIIPIAGFKLTPIWKVAEKKKIYALAKAALEDPNLKWVFQNAMYDLRLMYRICGVDVSKVRFDDIMIMQHVLDENAPLNLDDMACLHTDMGNYKQSINLKYKEK